MSEKVIHVLPLHHLPGWQVKVKCIGSMKDDPEKNPRAVDSDIHHV